MKKIAQSHSCRAGTAEERKTACSSASASRQRFWWTIALFGSTSTLTARPGCVCARAGTAAARCPCARPDQGALQVETTFDADSTFREDVEETDPFGEAYTQTCPFTPFKVSVELLHDEPGAFYVSAFSRGVHDFVEQRVQSACGRSNARALAMSSHSCSLHPSRPCAVGRGFRGWKARAT